MGACGKVGQVYGERLHSTPPLEWVEAAVRAAQQGLQWGKDLLCPQHTLQGCGTQAPEESHHFPNFHKPETLMLI